MQWSDIGDNGLTAMCDKGAEHFATGNFDMIRFDVFNATEVEWVKEYMNRVHPNVKFFTTRAV